MTLYELLGTHPRATAADLKAAFRKKAQEVHPDHHPDGPGNEDRFLEVRRAFEVLSDPGARAAYDMILNRIPVKPLKARPKAPVKTPGNRLNDLLWDLEPLVNRTRDASPEALELLRVLTFWDRWVLEPAGFVDYFWEARQLTPVDFRAYRDFLGPMATREGHFPYRTVAEYFWDIRKRTGKYLQIIDRRDLTAPIPGIARSFLEAIEEVLNRTGAFLSNRSWTPPRPEFDWW